LVRHAILVLVLVLDHGHGHGHGHIVERGTHAQLREDDDG
jgi:hypothetical protein